MHQPAHTMFSRLERCLSETGSLCSNNHHTGCPQTCHTPEFEEDILEHFADQPSTSTPAVAHTIGVNHMSVWQVLHNEQCHPYRLQKAQAMTQEASPLRVTFCRWLLKQSRQEPYFLRCILFSSGMACSTPKTAMFGWKKILTGYISEAINIAFAVNMWAVRINDHVIGPYLIPVCVNGPNYLVLL